MEVLLRGEERIGDLRVATEGSNATGLAGLL